MTQFEKERLYPSAKKILEALGYNTEENVHAQFLVRHHKGLVENPPRKRRRRGPKKKLK